MENEELLNVIKSFKSGVKSLNYDMINNVTLIELENGESFQLFGKHMEIAEEIDVSSNKCSFCGTVPYEPLFTINDDVYICKECSILSIKTYVKNGFQVDLNVSDYF